LNQYTASSTLATPVLTHLELELPIVSMVFVCFPNFESCDIRCVEIILEDDNHYLHGLLDRSSELLLPLSRRICAPKLGSLQLENFKMTYTLYKS
jgi:hypothetical protein